MVAMSGAPHILVGRQAAEPRVPPVDDGAGDIDGGRDRPGRGPAPGALILSMMYGVVVAAVLSLIPQLSASRAAVLLSASVAGFALWIVNFYLAANPASLSPGVAQLPRLRLRRRRVLPNSGRRRTTMIPGRASAELSRGGRVRQIARPVDGRSSGWLTDRRYDRDSGYVASISAGRQAIPCGGSATLRVRRCTASRSPRTSDGQRRIARRMAFLDLDLHGQRLTLT